MENTLTDEMVKSKIKKVEYTVLGDHKTTVANLYLENGYTVQGMSSCVDPENYDKELGEKISYNNAVQEVWKRESYLLAQRRYEAGLVKTDGE